MSSDTMTLRYFHLRLWESDEWNFDLKACPKAKGGVTVVYSPLGTYEDMKGRFCSFAVCSTKDNYDRAKGRDAAHENALEDVTIFVVADDKEDMVSSESTRNALLDAIFQVCGIKKRYWNVDELNASDLKKMQRFIGERKGRL